MNSKIIKMRKKKKTEFEASEQPSFELVQAAQKKMPAFRRRHLCRKKKKRSHLECFSAKPFCFWDWHVIWRDLTVPPPKHRPKEQDRWFTWEILPLLLTTFWCKTTQARLLGSFWKAFLPKCTSLWFNKPLTRKWTRGWLFSFIRYVKHPRFSCSNFSQII